MIPVGPFQGRLARDPEFSRMGQAQFPKWAVTVVVDEPGYDSSTRSTVVRPLWVRLEAVGSQAEDLADLFLSQGDEVAVTGRLAQFTVGEGDQKQTKTHVTPLFLQVTRRKVARPAATTPAPRSDYPAGGATDDPWGSAPAPTDPPF